jgi:hypothetical protein
MFAANTETVGAGAVTLAVTGQSFGTTSYQVSISTSWVTTIDVVTKTAAGFVVNFGTPAPAGGGTLDWVATSASATTTNPLTSGTVAIAAGVSQPVFVAAGSLPAAYQISIAPAWVTAYDVVSKTSAGFTVNFSVPAPPGGSTFDYIVFGTTIGTVTLADYLDELRDLLHDPDDRFWSATQKGKYINRARRQRDEDTAIQRSTIPFTLTTGTGTYTFATVGNGSIIDVISIILIFGQTRVLLDNVSLTELNQFYRTSTTFNGWTAGWARQGAATVIFGPTPSTAFATEWDCVVFGAPLVSLTDVDQVPYPYTKPVAFYAAYLAKMNERQRDEASDFMEDYMRLANESTGSRAPRIPNNYSGMGMWRR